MSADAFCPACHTPRPTTPQPHCPSHTCTWWECKCGATNTRDGRTNGLNWKTNP